MTDGAVSQAIAVVRRHEMRRDAGWLLWVDETDIIAMRHLDHASEITVRGWLALSRQLDHLSTSVREGRRGSALFARAGGRGGTVATLCADVLAALSFQLAARARSTLSGSGAASVGAGFEPPSSPELEIAMWYAKGVVADAALTLGQSELLDIAVLEQSAGNDVLAGASAVAQYLTDVMHRRHLALVDARTAGDA